MPLAARFAIARCNKTPAILRQNRVQHTQYTTQAMIPAMIPADTTRI